MVSWNLKGNKIEFLEDEKLKLTATHEKVIWIKQLEAEQRENALDAETSTIDKVTIKQIRISLGRKTVPVEDIHQVIELTVNVAANCELSVVGDLHVNQRRLLAKEGIHVVENLERQKLLVKENQQQLLTHLESVFFV